MHEYIIFEVPHRFRQGVGSTKVAADYLRWFVDEVPIRIEQLKRRVGHGPDAVLLDDSRSSLDVLGRWLDAHVSKRSLSELERSADAALLPKGVLDASPDWMLTDDSLSLAVDVGAYFGELLRRQFPKLHWDFVRKPKSHADLHQPVLVPFTGNTPLNPVAIGVNVAFASLSGGKAEQRLPQVYEAWAQHAPV